MKIYLNRIVDRLLNEALETSGAVLIEGPKWCGKTSTALINSKSHLYMQDPDQRKNNLMIAETKPSLLLRGDTPRLLDEWQIAPVLWDSVRHEVDKRGEPGQFILTGSSVPVQDNMIMHSGTGRISRIKMRTMSLFESGESNGEVSLSQLFGAHQQIAAISKLTIEQLAMIIVRGGWPASITAKTGSYEKRARDYVDAVINTDISSADGIQKDPQKVMTLLRSLARNVSTEASIETLRKDMTGADSNTLSTPTVTSYLNALRRIFVIEDQAAWNPSIRSKTPLRTSVKRHFIDPSIATAALGINRDYLLRDFNTFGLLFESLCIRDLRVYADAIDGQVFHYRDKSNLECDAIVVLRDGRWGAIEVKMGAGQFDNAAKNLLKFKDRIDTTKMSEPSFLMILSATDMAYTRKDNIHVVPLGCLTY